MAYIVFTSPTSGTASMGRIIGKIAGGHKIVRIEKAASDAPAGDRAFLDPDLDDTIYWFQGPRHWNKDIDLSRFRMIVHFRDPRDLACNQYWWALQHPDPINPPEVVEEKRRKIEAGGIDQHVRTRNLAGLFDIYHDLATRPDAAGATYTSYNQLCCAFDYLADNLCRVFDRKPVDLLDALRLERPENLTGNANWVKVGGTWKGSDVTPGRFRWDLKPETLPFLAEKYARDLQFCRDHDAPFLGVHYEP